MSQRTKLYIALAVLALAAAVFSAQCLLAKKRADPDEAERRQKAITDSLPQSEPPPPQPPLDSAPADTSHRPRKAPGR